MTQKPLLIITGPTASGKSTFALKIAAKFGGEIISADSMQIYRGCDVATAKPSLQDQESVPHHLIDIIEPTERFSAALWADQARIAIAQIRERGHIPIIVGGTGFYIRALLQPQSLAQVPPNPELRHELEQLKTEQLWQRLRQADSQAAQRVDAHNRPRIIRAIEVVSSNDSKKVLLSSIPDVEYRAFGLEWPRAILYKRINERVDAMLAAGFMEELQRLVKRYGADIPALNSVGYKEMLPVLEDSSLMPERVELWKRSTRRYAKRQMTWFRHQLEALRWLDAPKVLLDENFLEQFKFLV